MRPLKYWLLFVVVSITALVVAFYVYINATVSIHYFPDQGEFTLKVLRIVLWSPPTTFALLILAAISRLAINGRTSDYVLWGSFVFAIASAVLMHMGWVL